MVDLVKLNRCNLDGKTALDVAKDSNQTAVAQLLESKGALSVHSCPKTMVDYVLTEPSPAEAISRAFYYLTQELTLEMRSAVLVVATLIIAATYQVVLQPPAGIYPPPEEENKTAAAAAPPPHLGGQMVMRLAQYRYFMPLNTLAFAMSAVIIIFVVPGSPIFLILHLCLVFMCLSYLLALDAISYYTGISNMIYFMSSYAIFGAFLVKLFYYPIKALLVEEDWWLRRFSIKCSNLWARVGGHRDATSIMSIVYCMKKQNRVLYRK